MKETITERIKNLNFGKPQAWKNITLVPLLALEHGKWPYNVLADAIASGQLTISEVSEQGSVPQLRAINGGNIPVLIIDGEEVSGAKQNRVLNLSVLIRAGASTRLPVSCTEQGRWSYKSRRFNPSGHVMSMKGRSRKTRSVLHSLKASGDYSSDQREVWNEILNLQSKVGAPSPTSAMSDVFDKSEEYLKEGAGVLQVVPGQIGMIVFIGGIPVAAEFVSQPSAYSKLHPKLVRSYMLDALLEAKQPAAAQAVATAEDARSFLDRAVAPTPEVFPSVDLGTDYRFSGNGLTGTALVHEDEIIHAAFFHMEEN